MALFSSSKDLFELIPREDGAPSDAPVMDQSALLEIGGATIVIVDEWPEEVEAARPAMLTVRKDTAGVLGVTAAVLVGLAFLAGRATVKGEAAAKPPARGLPAGVFDPAEPEAGAPASAAPRAQAAAPTPAPTAVSSPTTPGAAPVIRRMNPAATHEMRVVTTSPAKARQVVEYLNTDPRSPLAGRPGLEAFEKRSGRLSQVRIGGFVGEDAVVKSKIEAMKDPTGGGSFRGAGYFPVSRR